MGLSIPNFVFSIVKVLFLFCAASGVLSSLESASLIGGKKVQLDEIKYLVSLQLDGEHFCGGSIVGNRHILTAAHCVFDEGNEFINNTIKVVAGTNNLNIDVFGAVEVYVEKIYVPAHYKDSEWETSVPPGDIAILKLKQNLELRRNRNLKKLILPRSNKRHQYKTYEKSMVTIAGFGWDKVKVKTRKNRTKFEIGSSTDRLLSAHALVISNLECQESYTNVIHGSELCAKVIEHDDDTPQGVCRGDSGSPLVYRSNTIIGVVSGISIGCNENNGPGIYVRVSSHIKFIKNALKDLDTNMSIKTY